MNSSRQIALASTLASALLFSACGNNDRDNVPPAGPGTTPVTGTVPGAVPAGAMASSTSFIDFLLGLVNDETSEPLSISEGFVEPSEDIGEARPFG